MPQSFQSLEAGSGYSFAIGQRRLTFSATVGDCAFGGKLLLLPDCFLVSAANAVGMHMQIPAGVFAPLSL